MSMKLKTVDWSSLTEISSGPDSESECDCTLTLDNSMNIEHVGNGSDNE